MSFSITSQAAESISIPLVMGYNPERESGNVVHPILGRADPDVTLKPLRLRAGTLELFMNTIEAAFALVEQLEEQGWQHLESTEAPLADMHFVVFGTVSIQADDDTDTFTVSVGFQEVLV